MERIKNIALVLFLALFIASLCFNVHHCITKQDEVFKDTVRTTFVDTIPYNKPVPRDSVVFRYVTQRLPTANDKEDNFPNKSVTEFPESVQKNPESGKNLQDSVQNFGKIVPESVNVIIPITQKVYEDSNYTAYVSGYDPRLDSLIFRMPKEVVTIKEYQKPKRWGIGIHAGYGMTIKGTPQFTPYIGIGISYNLFSF
jgi:hypothetical protein